MFITRMALDVMRAETKAALNSPIALGAAVKEAADSPERETAWRVEQLGYRTYLLMVSLYRPAMLTLHERFGIAGSFPSWETEDYDGVLESATEGTRWHFNLIACPQRIVRDAECAAVCVPAANLAAEETQKDWLVKTAAQNGFFVEKNEFVVMDESWRQRAEQNRVILWRQIAYEGRLTVTDQELFYRVLTEGVGLERGMGMGLLTVRAFCDK